MSTGLGTQAGVGDPYSRPSIGKIKVGTEKPTPKKKPTSERVTFDFNPTAPEAWRSDVAPIIQLYASQLMSQEEARERLGLGPVKKGETFAPDPSQMTPGQANKITTNPRKSAGLDNPKGITSKPPEQQEKPKEKKWRLNVGGETVDITENLE